MQERLQKIIARAGVSSRRAAEELVLAGRVRVNGRVVSELGAKADPREDKIEVDGKRLVAEDPIYLVLHKPKNVVSTMSDPEGRPTVAAYLAGAGGRAYPIGRLDFATSGVLLATNDGEFANGLLHPRRHVPKTYVVKVLGLMNDNDFDRWRNGVQLDDGPTLPADVKLVRYEEDKTWFEITLREGRNQQIRRMGEATGFRVMRLVRTSFAGITADGLRPGQWRSLVRDELLALKESFGVPKRVRTAGPPIQGGRIASHSRRPEGGRAAKPEGRSSPATARSSAKPGPARERPARGPAAQGAREHNPWPAPPREASGDRGGRRPTPGGRDRRPRRA